MDVKPVISPSSTRQYRKDIDGMRAIAVCSVILYHLYPTALSGGFVGVDIFFVISGYLISGHIFEALDSDSFNLLTFYVRRVRRIYPALLVVMIACLALGWFTLFTSEYQELGRLVAAGASFIVNIILWKTTSYFATSAKDQILLHLWSLGVEEQYYIIWPLLLIQFRQKLLPLFHVTLVLAAGSFLLNLALVHRRPTLNFYLPITRFWELLLGALLAYWHLYRKGWLDEALPDLAQTGWIQEALASLGLALLLISLMTFDSQGAFPGWYALVPTLGTLFLMSAPSSWISRVLLSSRIPVIVGVISYPLYLWHWPLLVFARILSDGSPTYRVKATLAVGTFVLAWLTYQYVEKPLRVGILFSRSSGARIAIGLFAVMLVVGAVGLAIDRSGNRLPFRFKGADTRTRLTDLQEISPGCKKKYPFATDFCRVSDESREPTALLLGDSHAIHFYSAMKEHFDERGENLLALGEGDCLPFLDVNVIVSQQAKKCPIMVNAALNLAVQQSSIHTIVLSAFSSFAVTGYNFSDETGDRKFLRDLQKPGGRDNETIFSDGLRRTLDAVATAQKKVYVVLDTPEIDFSPLSCWVHRPLSLNGPGLKAPCGIERGLVDKREALTTAVMLSVIKSVPGSTPLEPMSALCDALICLAGKDGVPFYFDRNHLTPAGARYVVQRLVWR